MEGSGSAPATPDAREPDVTPCPECGADISKVQGGLSYRQREADKAWEKCYRLERKYGDMMARHAREIARRDVEVLDARATYQSMQRKIGRQAARIKQLELLLGAARADRRQPIALPKDELDRPSVLVGETE